MAGEEPSTDKPRSGLGCAIVVIFFVGVAVAVYFYRQRQREDAVTASEGRITLENDNGGDMKVVNRRANQELYYRVMLQDVPLDSTLSLVCEWSDPSGNVVHRNRYKTKDIDKNPRQTHARYTIGPTAPVGSWKVRLLLRERELFAKTFEVRDGE